MVGKLFRGIIATEFDLDGIDGIPRENENLPQKSTQMFSLWRIASDTAVAELETCYPGVC